MNKTLIQSTEELYKQALDTMKKKNADYAGSTSSMKNFQISAQVANVKMSQGILTRLTDKTTRIGNMLIRDAQVKEESIFDTIQDLINYSAILYYAVQMEREEKAREAGTPCNPPRFIKDQCKVCRNAGHQYKGGCSKHDEIITLMTPDISLPGCPFWDSKQIPSLCSSCTHLQEGNNYCTIFKSEVGGVTECVSYAKNLLK